MKFTYPEKSPDYKMDLPGAKLSGRAILPQDVDARVLGDKRLLMQPYMSSYTVFGYMPQVGPDINEFFHVNQSVKSFVYVAKKLLRTWADAARYQRPVLRSNGNALMTRMVKSADDLGVRLWNSSPVLSLTRDDAGTITGAVLGGEHAATVEARLGVILAAGGFSGSTELRKQYFPHDRHGDDHFTPTVGHGGDAATPGDQRRRRTSTIRSFSVGSWAPVTVFKYLNGNERLFPHLRAIGLPGLIAVDRHGKRFGNEALSYHDFGGTMIAHNEDEDKTFGYRDRRRQDHAQVRHRLRQALADAARLLLQDRLPGQGRHPGGAGRQARHRRRGSDRRPWPGSTRAAERGEDPAFGRGSTLYNHFRGDMEHKPNPNLAPLDKGPYYAAKIQMGDLGTFAGIGVNERSEVTTEEGTAIPGLIAVGAAAVSVFGGGYPGYSPGRRSFVTFPRRRAQSRGRAFRGRAPGATPRGLREDEVLVRRDLQLLRPVGPQRAGHGHRRTEHLRVLRVLEGHHGAPLSSRKTSPWAATSPGCGRTACSARRKPRNSAPSSSSPATTPLPSCWPTPSGSSANSPNCWTGSGRTPTDANLFVEELARFRGTVQRASRITTEEVEVAGVRIPAGAIVGCCRPPHRPAVRRQPPGLPPPRHSHRIAR